MLVLARNGAPMIVPRCDKRAVKLAKDIVMVLVDLE